MTKLPILAALLGIRLDPIPFRPVQWNLRPSPERPEGQATDAQKNATLAGRRGKGTRKSRKKRGA